MSKYISDRQGIMVTRGRLTRGPPERCFSRSLQTTVLDFLEDTFRDHRTTVYWNCQSLRSHLNNDSNVGSPKYVFGFGPQHVYHRSFESAGGQCLLQSPNHRRSFGTAGASLLGSLITNIIEGDRNIVYEVDERR